MTVTTAAYSEIVGLCVLDKILKAKYLGWDECISRYVLYRPTPVFEWGVRIDLQTIRS